MKLRSRTHTRGWAVVLGGSTPAKGARPGISCGRRAPGLRRAGSRGRQTGGVLRPPHALMRSGHTVSRAHRYAHEAERQNRDHPSTPRGPVRTGLCGCAFCSLAVLPFLFHVFHASSVVPPPCVSRVVVPRVYCECPLSPPTRVPPASDPLGPRSAAFIAGRTAGEQTEAPSDGHSETPTRYRPRPTGAVSDRTDRGPVRRVFHGAYPSGTGPLIGRTRHLPRLTGVPRQPRPVLFCPPGTPHRPPPTKNHAYAHERLRFLLVVPRLPPTVPDMTSRVTPSSRVVRASC